MQERESHDRNHKGGCCVYVQLAVYVCLTCVSEDPHSISSVFWMSVSCFHQMPHAHPKLPSPWCKARLCPCAEACTRMVCVHVFKSQLWDKWKNCNMMKAVIKHSAAIIFFFLLEMQFRLRHLGMSMFCICFLQLKKQKKSFKFYVHKNCHGYETCRLLYLNLLLSDSSWGLYNTNSGRVLCSLLVNFLKGIACKYILHIC